MRSIWNGAIGFGLVSIPIKLYSAVEDSSLDLDMLDRHDLSNIRFKRVNEETGLEVEWKDIVKGYNLDGRYIVLEEKDFLVASPEKSRVLAIQQFVQEEEIDSVYFEAPYFTQPQKNSEHPYNLLVKALLETGMVGIGTFVMREREALAILRPYRKRYLLLQKMRFRQEIRVVEELEIKPTRPKPEEIEMAVALIEQLSSKFKPEKYEDRYTEELMNIIEEKAKGHKIKKIKPLQQPGVMNDIMAQLKASLSGGKNKKIS